MRWHGRVKDVIKTGGINVAPLEIENLLLTHPAVAEAYVVGVPDEDQGESAIAFVVLTDRSSEAELKSHVRSIAASFKVPRRVLVRRPTDIPRTTSDKVAKPALRELAAALLRSDSTSGVGR